MMVIDYLLKIRAGVLLLIILSSISLRVSADTPPIREEIEIESTDYNPVKQRSQLPNILSFYSEAQLEFIFYRSIGTVCVSIYNHSGLLILETIIDTDNQFCSSITLPSSVSQFVIVIEGESYLGYGSRNSRCYNNLVIK